MAITLAQLASSIDDPQLGNRVIGAAIAAAKRVVEQQPQPTNHAGRLAFCKRIWNNPQTEAKPMIRVLLADSYTTPALTWDDTPEPGQSNLIINVTDAAMVDAVFAKWDVFVALDA